MISKRGPVAFIEARSVDPVSVTGIYLIGTVHGAEPDFAAD